MKKTFIVAQFILLLAFSYSAFSSNLIPPGLFTITVASAADNSQFQNTSPWFANWWGKVKSEASSIVSWFQSFTQGAVGGRSAPTAQAPLNQYPALSGQNSGNSQPQLPFPTQSGGDSQQQGEGNGTPGSPYKLEPNQFKKMCGQNTYVLYWRKGGKEGKDMAQPAGGAGAGKDQGAKDIWQLPTCKELAQCHCCCNTCKYEPPYCPQDGWTFDKPFGCYPKQICSQCNEVCNPKCSQWNKPDYPTQNQSDLTLNRDCKCQKEGCKDTGPEDCSIIIIDPGRSQVEFTKKDGQPEQYYKGTGIAYFKNGNGPSDPKSKVLAEPDDKTSNGWVKKLKDQKGVCCKCYQDGPPIQ